MIDHQYKCIFIHIPRTAGSSIEQWINGQDWWITDSPTKHIIASQAKHLYADYWKDYFKFSIVREPISRVISSLKYDEYFGLSLGTNGNIDFSKYLDLFGKSVVLEHDYRFSERKDLLNKKHLAGSIYGNILDEELDFIGKYENLAEDTAFIAEKIGLNTVFTTHIEKSEPKTSHDKLSKSTIRKIKNLYKLDYKQFYSNHNFD